jgi:hypothetical protein
MSVGREPQAVAAGLADSLVEVLQLDLAFVRMSDPGGVAAIEVTRPVHHRCITRAAFHGPRRQGPRSEGRMVEANLGNLAKNPA